MSKKILLIGGSSDLGRALGKMLPFDFYNFDINNNNPFVEKYINGSITNPNDLIVLKEQKFEAVIHISGIHPILESAKNLELMREVNIKGVKNVLDAVQNISNFIYISSSAASKDSEYGKTKAKAEKVVSNFLKNKSYGGYSLRVKGFTPYYSPSYKSFIDYANWVLTGAVHIEDVVNAIYLCIMNAKPDFEIFVVDGKQDFSEHEIVNWSKDILKTKYPNHNDFIDLLKTPESAPKYTKPENSIGYYPNFGFSKVVDEFSKLN